MGLGLMGNKSTVCVWRGVDNGILDKLEQTNAIFIERKGWEAKNEVANSHSFKVEKKEIITGRGQHIGCRKLRSRVNDRWLRGRKGKTRARKCSWTHLLSSGVLVPLSWLWNNRLWFLSCSEAAWLAFSFLPLHCSYHWWERHNSSQVGLQDLSRKVLVIYKKEHV